MALPIWALYMQKVYADRSLNVNKGDFEKPLQPLSVSLDCDKFESQPSDEDEIGEIEF